MTSPGAEPIRTCKRCPLPAADDSELCVGHRDAERERVKIAMRASRKRKRRAKRCLWCPKKALPGELGCLACKIRRGRLKARGVTATVTKDRDLVATRTEQRMESDGWKRTRFHGQSRTGPQSRAQLDDQDLESAIRALQQAKEGLRLARAPEMAELPRIQREENVRAALSHADLAVRFVEDVLDRNRPRGARGATHLTE